MQLSVQQVSLAAAATVTAWSACPLWCHEASVVAGVPKPR